MAEKLKQKKSDFPSLAGMIIGTFIPIVAIIAIFIPAGAVYLVPMAIAFTIMGIFLGYFSYKSNK